MRTMRVFIGIWVLLCLTPLLCRADVYVTDALDIPCRRGPSLQHKILKMLDSGEPLRVLEEQAGWSRVQLLDKEREGIEGWVLSRYLSTRTPCKTQAQALKEENESLKNELLVIKEKVQTEIPRALKLDEAYKKNLEELNALKKEYDRFKREAAQFIQLKGAYEKVKHNEERLARELEQLENNKRNKWFALGALVVLFGIIIGLQIGKLGRRSHSSLYP